MLDHIIASIAEDFGRNLRDLFEKAPPEGWTPTGFRGFLNGLTEAVNTAGRSALEAALEEADVRDAEVEVEGSPFQAKAVHPKEWLSQFGTVVANRQYYRPADRDGAGFCPLDVRCGMVGRYMTPDVEELAAYSSAHMVPREVERLMGLLLPDAPSATAVQRVVRDLGRFVTENEEAIEDQIAARPLRDEDADILVVSWDGVTVPMREPGVKMGKKPERPGLDDHSEVRTTYREAGVSCISRYRPRWDEEGHPARPERVEARVLARMPEPHMASLLCHQEKVLSGMISKQSFRRIAVICDGKRAIWDSVGALSCLDEAVLILDFYHAAEHLSKAAALLFGKSSAKATAWYDKYRRVLRDECGGVAAVIRSIRYYRDTLLKPDSHGWQDLEKELGYFRRNGDKMDYARYRQDGLPIGSGPVEAACKTVVSQRLKRSGMRWSTRGGQDVLNIRTLVLSEQWEAGWEAWMSSRAA